MYIHTRYFTFLYSLHLHFKLVPKIHSEVSYKFILYYTHSIVTSVPRWPHAGAGRPTRRPTPDDEQRQRMARLMLTLALLFVIMIIIS